MNIGIIAEGITDIPVLNNIISGVLNNNDIIPNPLFPSQPDEGGWGNVFNFIRGEDFIAALIEHDILIMQLDADSCQDWGLKLNTYNEEIDIKEFLQSIQKALFDFVNKILKENKSDSDLLNKVVLAISISSIECWLLTYHEQQKGKKAKLNNCFNALNQLTSKKFGFTIHKGGSKQKFDNPKRYDELSRPFIKVDNINSSIEFNYSFKKFVEDFKTKHEQLTTT
jgi:hypothetical protein